MFYEKKHSLLPHNTFGIACKADAYGEYESLDDLRLLIAQQQGGRILHIGRGSNLLFLGRRFHGLVLHNRMHNVELISQRANTVLVRVGGGMVWDEFVQCAIAEGWHGLENLSFIPGEVGAAAVQNIGAYGAEVCQFIESVECVHLPTGDRRAFACRECNYAYRSSMFKASPQQGQWAVVSVIFKLERHFRPILNYQGLRSHLAAQSLLEKELTAEQVRAAIGELRSSKLPDPAVLGNAGSFFKNPIVNNVTKQQLLSLYPDMPFIDLPDDSAKVPAAWLIEKCGWKGRQMGRAAVYDRQPLVLVNCGGACGADIRALSDAICADVRERFSVRLEPEVQFVS